MRLTAPRLAVLPLAGLLVAASASGAAGQSMLDLLRSVEEGGGWVHIPVEAGRGTWVSDPLPTLGLTLTGCMQVYGGHSGRWEIQARDALGEGRLDASVVGGERVPFRYRTNARAQLTVEARWSEARDTTLMVWVGLERPGRDRDPCEPVYGSSGG